MKGIHSLARVVGDLLGLGVPGSCVVPVLNRSPWSRRSRAELTAALAALIRSGAPVTSAEQAGIASPIFLPERRIEECLRDGVRLPGQLTTPLTGAVRAVLERRDGRTRQVAGPEPVAPGSISHWGAEAEEALG